MAYAEWCFLGCRSRIFESVLASRRESGHARIATRLRVLASVWCRRGFSVRRRCLASPDENRKHS